MISYTLKCKDGHSYDSWFQSAVGFDALRAGGHLTCAVCGTADVDKAIMAPRLAAGATAEAAGQQRPRDETAAPMLKGAPPEVEKALRELRRKVEETARYVGGDFTRQARAMHLGDLPETPIYGEARPDQARALIEDGVPLMPLPFRPRRQLS